VAVARALANNPPIILADEPTGSLDTDAGRDLMNLLHELNHSQGTTFIIVTHDPAVARQTNRIIVLEDGKVARENIIGSPIEEDLKIWRYSGLGRRIVNGDHDNALKDLTISDSDLCIVRNFLEQAGD
jgi:ABC-type methionine transport system ATPase subunit